MKPWVGSIGHWKAMASMRSAPGITALEVCDGDGVHKNDQKLPGAANARVGGIVVEVEDITNDIDFASLDWDAVIEEGRESLAM